MAVYSDNSKAFFDYEILERLEAGLVLTGSEVKSVKNGHVSIKGAYVKIFGPATSSGRSSEAFLVGATITPYQTNNLTAKGGKDYDPQRTRKLLLKKSQLKYLIGKSQEAGLTLVPINLHSKNNFIKLEVGIGRGKKKYDKRETIKQRDTERAIRRGIK